MQSVCKARFLKLKMAALCAALFCFLMPARTVLAQDWTPSLGISIDTQAGYLAEAYTNRKYGRSSGGGRGSGSLGGAGSSGGKAKLKITQAPIALSLRLQRVVALDSTLPFDLSISGAVKWSRVSLLYPNGIGVLVDPLSVRSQSLGLEVRGGALFARSPQLGSIEAGIGLNAMRAVDRFNYGTWRIVERRSDAVSFGYLRYEHKVVGRSSIFAEGLVSRHGTSVALGLDWKL